VALLVLGGVHHAGVLRAARGWIRRPPEALFDPYQYTFLQHLHPLNKWTSYFAFLLAIGQLPFVYNFFRSVFAGTKAEANPWEIGTLEWTLPSLPCITTSTSSHGTSRTARVRQPGGQEALGRDWIGQTEELPEKVPAKPAAAAS
jgi:cytochrome c oxidase subunit 1